MGALFDASDGAWARAWGDSRGRAGWACRRFVEWGVVGHGLSVKDGVVLEYDDLRVRGRG